MFMNNYCKLTDNELLRYFATFSSFINMNVIDNITFLMIFFRNEIFLKMNICAILLFGIAPFCDAGTKHFLRPTCC